MLQSESKLMHTSPDYTAGGSGGEGLGGGGLGGYLIKFYSGRLPEVQPPFLTITLSGVAFP